MEDQRVRAGERGLGSLPLGCCGPQLLLGALCLLPFFCLLGPGVIRVLCCGQFQGAFPSLVDYPKPSPAVVSSPLIGLRSSQCPRVSAETGGWRLLFDSAAGDQVPGIQKRVRLSAFSKGALRLMGDTEGPAQGPASMLEGCPLGVMVTLLWWQTSCSLHWARLLWSLRNLSRFRLAKTSD